MTVALAAISDTELSLDAHLAAVDDDRAGAVTTFLGRVRDHDPDAAGEVVALEYSSHPDAERILRDLAEQAVATGVSGEAIIAVSHRIGRLPVGSAAVIVAVASAHRDEAFVVCREMIEAIKRELPVWKRQVEADGTTAWKGIGG
ncbi:MAG: moaE1 [Microbacterium sp.]|jgi:molybdopterin synthase catalytic subunit|uniref:molybdenum cofactor biosynthesis protein MoaE n=1 Tax=Microbacterium sp. TaxID=51671 RepID=UPI00260850D5|nr:molybdenum cofactor biosynthesis protein MoaE [Microbacterium sp.]MDF2561919.1 moaE1 [Microbacterium sp.]